MQPEALLDLFDQLAERLSIALDDLDDWGLSGNIPGQYNHDVLADDLIVQELLNHGFRTLTEESGITGTGDVTVVVDPIDGSTNASLGLPWYATSLCAVDAKGPVAAGVYNLATGASYRAVRGEGAETSHGMIQPADTALSDAVISFSGLPPKHGGWGQYRTFGAGALDMCAVATGTFGAFVDIDAAHGVWDYLGAWLVCHEAGVSLAERDGRDLVLLDPLARRGPIAAATPELMAEIQTMLQHWS